MSWRPEIPEQFFQFTREHNGVRRPIATSVLMDVVREGDLLRCTTSSAPHCLVADKPLPWRPPGVRFATDPTGFQFWWRQLTYAFDLPNPSAFPPLPEPFPDVEATRAARFVYVTESLAASAAVSSPGGITMSPAFHGEEEIIQTDFPPVDAQVGFAGLLRQCHNASEPASFKHVHNALWLAASSAQDQEAPERITAIKDWHRAIKSLRRNSLDQLIRDKLVREEGCGIFAWQEEMSPEQLLRTFNYGDLIHWGDGRVSLSTSDDEFAVVYQRYEFLRAGLGLAHIYIGFGELVRAASTPVEKLLVP